MFYEGHTHPLTSLCALCHMDYNTICELQYSLFKYVQYHLEVINKELLALAKEGKELSVNLRTLTSKLPVLINFSCSLVPRLATCVEYKIYLKKTLGLL